MSKVIRKKLANMTSSVQILPVLAEMTARIGGSPENFCQMSLLALWQLDSVIHHEGSGPVLWHGQVEPRHDGLLFCSQLMLPVGMSVPQLDKMIDFFGTGIITNSVYKGRLWKIGCNLPCEAIKSTRSKGSGKSVSDGLYGILTLIRDLKRDMAGMTQEMFMTNQGVMAMVEEMGLWLEADGSRHEISDLLAERLESNRQLIERLREKEQALQQADRLATIGRLVAGVAHEINNPLTFIKMNAELLSLMLDRYFAEHSVPSMTEAQYKRPVEAVIRGVERIADIVSGLKFFSRQAPKEKTGVQLTKCLDEAWGLIKSNKELSKAVELRVSIEPGVMIYGNAQQLEQILINLLHNALKAVDKGRPSQGIISVSTCRETCEIEWVVIMITDNGCGISQSAISKIFEPFYTSDDENGTGLGLSIVQGIVHEHGGNIGVMSRVGEGTTFTIRLPAWRLQEEDN
ncbi:sensor histidine kinase [Pelosinus sp. sgz500959]|uniref:sensor histidine kinase n=1 Tax=Pelosinus sp. sgz500959 TaxID=3242472 RepID=UPI003670DC8A